MNPQADIKITELLGNGPFTVSVEIVPPRNGSDPAVIRDQLHRLTEAGAQFMSVTKGAGGSLRGGSLPIAQTIKERYRLPCIAHFTCRDLLPEEVENQLIDHHLFGIRNILALRGDPPQGVAGWTPREGSHPLAYKLVEQICALNRGEYFERKGFAVGAREKTDFCVGVACYPDHPDREERIRYHACKVEAGAEYAISQMLFDADSYARYCDETSGPRDIPILPGTRLLKSREQAHKMASRFEIPIPNWYQELLPETDKEATIERSLNAFFTLTDKLKRAGAPGVHVFVLSDTAMAELALKKLTEVAPVSVADTPAVL